MAVVVLCIVLATWRCGGLQFKEAQAGHGEVLPNGAASLVASTASTRTGAGDRIEESWQDAWERKGATGLAARSMPPAPRSIGDLAGIAGFDHVYNYKWVIIIASPSTHCSVPHRTDFPNTLHYEYALFNTQYCPRAFHLQPDAQFGGLGIGVCVGDWSLQSASPQIEAYH